MFNSSLTLETGSAQAGGVGRTAAFPCLPLLPAGARETPSQGSSGTFVPKTPTTHCQGGTGGCEAAVGISN